MTIETFIGTLVIACIAAYFTWRNNFKSRHASACAAIRAAFAPDLAQIHLAQNHVTTHDCPSIEDFVKNNLLAHASVIEEFRPFVPRRNRAAYQEAWESYRKLANDSIESSVEDRMAKPPYVYGGALEKNIHKILSYAKET